MCGHVGLAGKLEMKDEATMKRLLVLDYFRGPDSTGFAALRKSGEVKISKMATNPIDLFDTNRFKDALSGWNSTVFLGHNRFATKGGVNNMNAHPYEFDHIVGAHNGTLDVSSWNALETAIGEKFPVDSMAIIAGIAKLGIEAVIPMLKGAWALVWINKIEGTLNFLRNKERPFWYAYTSDFTKVLWASEYVMIQAATKMSPVAYDMHVSTDGFTYFQSKEDWWYRYDLDELQKGKDGRPKPRVKELKGKEADPVKSYAGAGAWPQQQQGGSVVNHPFHTHSQKTTKPSSTQTQTGSTTGSALHGTTEQKNNVHVLNLSGTKKDPMAGFLSKERFDAIARFGCSWCQADVEFEEPGVAVYEDRDVVICSQCRADEEVTHIYTQSNISG